MNMGAMNDFEANEASLWSVDQIRLHTICITIQTGLVLANSAISLHVAGACQQVAIMLQKAVRIRSDAEVRIGQFEAEGLDAKLARGLLQELQAKLREARKDCGSNYPDEKDRPHE
jgi:hypothetical protein